MMTHYDLQVRETHKYVGTYQHLDRWREIGRARVIGTEQISKDADGIEEAQVVRHTVTVHSEAPDDEIARALRDTFTRQGCAHEYDCCGCWSHTARRPRKLSPGCWEVDVSSSRNY